MTDVTTTRNARPKPKRGNGAAAPVPVNTPKLARHFGVVSQNIDYLVRKGIIERRADGLFDQDVSRLKYFDHLRSEHRRSPRATADAEHAKAKTALLQIRIMEKQRVLVRRDAHEAMIDQMAGLVLTKLGGWPARIAGQDLGLRRRAELLLRELGVEVAEACTKLADEQGEPPLDQQD
jgi:hypothetical protein